MKVEESYIVGLIDGEGTINLVKYPDGRIRPQVLIFNTHRKILEIIKKQLNLTAPILKTSRVNNDKIKRKRITYRLQIRSKEDIKKIFNIFEKYPPIIKRKDYKKVRKFVISWLTT